LFFKTIDAQKPLRGREYQKADFEFLIGLQPYAVLWLNLVIEIFLPTVGVEAPERFKMV
jgi:hypothetical protein